MSRSSFAKKNIMVGIVYKLIAILLPFINRTIILYTLGADYTGLGSLFSSVLQVLNLAELGFGSAVAFCMYRPIAKKDYDEVNSILNFYRKVYKIIGFVVLTIGIILLPFLPNFIQGGTPENINIFVLFSIYLIDSVLSYTMFAYKSTLLIANQRNDIVNSILSVSTILKNVIQGVLLLVTHNYYYYVLSVPIFTIINNLVTSYCSDRLFPQYKCTGVVDKETKSFLGKKVRGLLLSRLCDIARNASDQIIISAILGLSALACFSNYFYIISSIYGILKVITTAVTASVGNSIASDSVEKNFNDYNKFGFMFGWLRTWFTISLICLFQPFMTLWVGDKLVLSNFCMLLFCIYFYGLNQSNFCYLYFEAAGLWDYAKKAYIIQTIVNITLNIVLGKWLGIAGVLIATNIAIFFCDYLFQAYVLFNKYFNKIYRKKAIKLQMLYLFTTIICALICICLCGLITYFTNNLLLIILIRVIICISIPNIICYLIYRRTELFKEVYMFVKKQLIHA